MKKLPLFVALWFLISFQSVQARTLKIATIAPEGTSWMKEIRKGAKKISKLTHNHVKFKFYTGGVMGNEKNVLKKMRVGQLQGGVFTSSVLANIYPDAQIYNLPFLFKSDKEVDYVRSKMDEIYKNGFSEKGLVVLGMSHGGFAYIMSDTPIRTVQDARSKKVWLPEGVNMVEAIYKVARIHSIPLAMSDVYTGLQTGMIDTIGSNTTGAIAFQWHTKIKYVTDFPLVYTLGIVAVDKKSFSKLDTVDQTIVLEEMGKIMDGLGEKNRQDNSAARAALIKQGIKFVSLSADERTPWREIGAQAIKMLKKEQAFSPEMYNTVQRLLQDYRKVHLTDTRNGP